RSARSSSMASERVRRRRALLVAGGLAIVLTALPSAAKHGAVVAIIKSSPLLPFEEAMAAIVSTVKRDPLEPEVLTFDLDGNVDNGNTVLERIHRAQATVVITVGSLATTVALRAPATEPVIFSMVLYAEQSGFRSTATRGV